jgi:hypothetical protein
MRVLGWWAVLPLLLALVGLLNPLPVAGQSQPPVEWLEFNVDFDIGGNGVIHVTETQVIRFNGGPYRTAFAELSLNRVEQLGNVTVSEVNENGDVIAYEQSRSSDLSEAETYSASRSGSTVNVDFRFEPARNETRTFLLEYDLAGAIRVYRDLDPPNLQFWWVPVSNDTTSVAPVRSSTVTVHLPEAVPLDQVVVLNEDGAVAGDPGAYSSDGHTFTWHAQNLEDGDQLEIRLQFPDILPIGVPEWQQADDNRREAAEQDAERRDLYNLIFIAIAALGAVVGGLLLYALWYTRGRDPQVGLIANFLPTPPDDLPPGAAGALIDEQADERDLVATIVDLGHKGVLQIEDVTSATGPDMKLTLKENDAQLNDFEQTLIKDLFDNNLEEGRSVTIGQGALTNPKLIKDALYAEIVKRGYYDRSPQETRENFKSISKVLMIGSIIGLFVLPGVFGVGSAALPMVVLFILGLVLRSLAGGMPRRTEAGAEAAAKWNAFKRYLDDIQKYEKLEESADIFAKYLPYAVAFGIDRSWVKKFTDANTPAPNWFGPLGPVVVLPGGGGGFGSYPRPQMRPRGGGWWIPGTGGMPGGQGGSGDGGGGGGEVNLPDFGGLQDWSDRGARNLQSGSDTLIDMLNSAGKAFGGFGGGGGGRRSGSFGSFGGGGGRSFGGFSGGGSRGGGGGGGRRGFG